jgi:hypothetical protein
MKYANQGSGRVPGGAPHRAKRLQGFGKHGIERGGRMEKEIAIFEFDHSHACRERQWKPNAQHRQILEWAVDDADVPREWLILVKRFVRRVIVLSRHTNLSFHETGSPASEPQIFGYMLAI